MRNSLFRRVKKSGGWNRFVVAEVLMLALVSASCNRGPGRVHQPGIDASAAGSQAMEMYDTNGDGKVSDAELDKAPALKAALARLDTNGDKGVRADEVAERVRVWQGMLTGLMSFSFTVTLDGSPLEGALVTFVPEQFLGDEIKAADCTTNAYGSGSGTIPKEDRPSPTTPPGMHLGLYKVKISKVVGGRETIPPKYAEETVLGQEVAYDVPEISNNRVVYSLSTK